MKLRLQALLVGLVAHGSQQSAVCRIAIDQSYARQRHAGDLGREPFLADDRFDRVCQRRRAL